MKRLLVLLAILTVFIAMLTACVESAPISDATITLTDGNGKEANIDVDEYTDISDYRLVRADTAGIDLKDAASELRDVILEKTGVDVGLNTDWSGSSQYEIILGETKNSRSKELSAELGEKDFSIRHENGKIFILGGSDAAISEAAALFAKCFVYEQNESFLLPVGEGYTFMKEYVFEKLTVEGSDITEFSIYAADTLSAEHSVIKTAVYAEELSELFEEKLIGSTLRVAKEMGVGHYIVLSGSNIDADGYSVRIENGNIYIEGSFVSVDAAYNAFLSEMLGYTDGEGESSRSLALTSSDNIEGSMGFTVPYTKQELLDLFSEASESSEMVLSGNHAYQIGTEKGKIASTSDAIFEASGKRPCILEIDVGRHSVYYDFYGKGDTITDYDLSVYVSEAAQHVSEGGIVSVCIHMANPLKNASDSVWYRGHLGSEEMARAMLTDGTEMNDALRKTLESTFKLIEGLRDNGIPFMFRPLHEMNGGWFWWCVNQGSGVTLSKETMQDFWKFFYNVVTEELGVDDAIWVYAPNYNNGGCADVLYAYPGDEYVDIVGCDWYTNGNYEVNDNESFTRVMSTGKPSALTEVGPASGGALAAIDANGKTYYTWTCEDLLGAIKDMIRDEYKVAYFLPWTGTGSIAGLGKADVLMNDEIILTLDELAARWESLK